MVLPYLKGLVIIKCGFFYLACGSIVYSVFVVIIFADLFRFLTSGIRALSLGRHCGQIFFCIHKENIIVSINPSCMHNFINVQLVNRLQVPIKNIQSTDVEGENVQIFKDLKITMDKYVLHSDFYAMNMDEVDIVLGYPWIESVGTININVQKKFLKLWYKKKKITLRDVSLIKKDGPMEDSKEVIAQSEVESEAESTEGDEAKLQEGHNQEAKEVIDSKAQSVADFCISPSTSYRDEKFIKARACA
jgi:hypothetical protein